VNLINVDMGWITGIGFLGAWMGILQWLVLKRHFPHAGWWILASVGGWVAGIPVGTMVGWNGLGAVYGAITGGTLVLLLRHRENRRHAARLTPDAPES